MTEAQFWSVHVRPVLHQPTQGLVAWKVGPPPDGIPDIMYNACGRCGLLELKFCSHPDGPDDPIDLHVRVKQTRHMVLWKAAAGQAHLLVGFTSGIWMLLPPACTGADNWELLAEVAIAGGSLDEIAKLLPVLQVLGDGGKLRGKPKLA